MYSLNQNKIKDSDLIATDSLLFQQLKFPLQLRLPLHLLLCPTHKDRLAVELSAIHVLYCLMTKDVAFFF